MTHYLARLVVVSLVALGGVFSQAHAASRSQINADVNAALHRFDREIGGARGLVAQAAGVLVFPSVVKAGFGIGGEYGEGALRRGGKTAAYYNIVSASIGFQLGVQVRTVIIIFMTDLKRSSRLLPTASALMSAKCQHRTSDPTAPGARTQYFVIATRCGSCGSGRGFFEPHSQH